MVNAITSLRSGYLIYYNLEDLINVPIQLSPSLTPPSFPKNDYALRDATASIPINSSFSWPTNLVDHKETKDEESRKGDDSSQPLTVEQVHKPTAPFPNRLRNKKDHAHVDKIRETFYQVKINIPLLDVIQQMLPYAKFLKELCITKRMTNVPKKAFFSLQRELLLSSTRS